MLRVLMMALSREPKVLNAKLVPRCRVVQLRASPPKALDYINTGTPRKLFHSVISTAVRTFCRTMTHLVFNSVEFCAAITFLLASMCMDPRFSKSAADASSTRDECQVTPVIHVLQYPGCVPKPIPSFACIGRCASYLQVSGSKIWQMERSCMCCQESGEREASVSLFCPKAKPGERKFRKVSTKAPLECMCRPCTGVEESAVIPQEIAGYGDESPLSNHFRKSHKD